jgi:GSH-dependent disulfide-bond oxidoreductase
MVYPSPIKEKMMINLYYWTTPNGHKITIFLEEAGLPYKIVPINIGKGMQFEPDFLRISPNNKIPALVDEAPVAGDKPLAIFESGAILLYLADKIKKFIPGDLRGRYETIEWLMWQMAGLGPMAGQNHHFQSAAERIPYAIERYVNETARLYGVLNKQLGQHEFIAGDYSIADMASFPWVLNFDKQEQDLANFPNIKRWLTTICKRPAVKRAFEVATKINPGMVLPAFARRIMDGEQTS